jgi:hypothetical protein
MLNKAKEAPKAYIKETLNFHEIKLMNLGKEFKRQFTGGDTTWVSVCEKQL